jgi:hypothetical protein
MADNFAPKHVRQPDFANQCTLWAAQTHLEMRELEASTKKEVAISHDLLSKVDRILARR